ncbi:MAG: ABC transporter ATPase, partial [Chlorobi bacterium OLB5]
KMIKIENLTKKFGKNEALKGVELEMGSGSVIAIMGPNGSGKTTLLKCILGLVKADEGKIYVKNCLVNGECDYKRHIGYMPQYSCFPENLKVKEVMAMIKDIRGNNMKYDEELIEKLKIAEMNDKQISQLSGGMKQRVSSAAAFLFNAEIIILDEPTAGLDPVSSEIVKNKILEEKQKGKLVIITSHIVSEVEAMADRIIYMLEGKIYFDETKEKLYSATGKQNLNKAIAHLINAGEEIVI